MILWRCLGADEMLKYKMAVESAEGCEVARLPVPLSFTASAKCKVARLGT